MTNATVSAKLRKVGNSLAFFIPADVKDELGLKEGEQVVAELQKKTDKKKLLSLFGALKGKKLEWSPKDRADYGRE